MENDQENRNGVSSLVSYFDLILYFLLAAAFILYGMYSVLVYLSSLGVGYFVVGIILFSGMIIQISHDLYHNRIGPLSKIVIGIWSLATIIIIIGDLVSTF